jgi:hypothetical protein
MKDHENRIFDNCFGGGAVAGLRRRAGEPGIEILIYVFTIFTHYG